MRIALLAVAAAALVTADASAQPMFQAPPTPPEPTTNPTTTADDAARGDPDKIVCRSMRPPTGTRMRSARTRQKVCMSKADWEQQEEEARQMLKLRDSGFCTPSVMNGHGNDCNGG